jgi:2-keto-3-deoxy-L-fuconate dehydrogenase
LTGNSHSFRLDGKLAVVTGAASGIGRAVAQQFAASGACVRLLDIDEKAAQAVTSEILAAGGSAKAYGCDVSQKQHVDTAFGKILEEGPIHILVNNAGISHVGNLEATSEQEFDKVFSVNVKGMYNCMCATVSHMKSNGGGTILNMASIAGTSGLADRFAY